MKHVKVETIGNATLYLGDCLEILPTLDKVDAVITDPPYGIKEARGKNKSRGLLAVSKDYGYSEWDDKPCSDEQIKAMMRASEIQVIFGGNYFNLPPSSCWLVWDKQNGNTDFADCELAWTNMDKAVRKIEWMWHGMLRKGKDTERFHPTQKPIEVMEWCVQQCKNIPQTILDPFMGSGTTGVACMNLGRKFIGIEIEPKYFDIACERIEQSQKQIRMFE
jgi:DNA modification methylase